MLILLICLIIMLLIVSILILSIKYYKTYARLKSRDTFYDAAKRQMGRIKYKEPHITCDYCGASIDTAKDKVCPQCGAGYGNDKEWLNRFKVDQEQVDKKAEKAAQKEISKAETEAKKIAQRIRGLLVSLALVIVSLIIVVRISDSMVKHRMYSRTEDLNEYSYENYEPADYEIVGDGVLLNQGGVVIKIEGIYFDKVNDNIKIGYHFYNNNDYDCKMCFKGVAVNGYAQDVCSFYELLSENSDVVLYSKVYCQEKIESLVFGEFYVSDYDYNTIYESDDCVKVETTVNDNTPPVLSDGTVLFDNDSITIMGLGYEDDGNYYFQVLNKTDEVLKMECKDGKFKDKSVDIYGSNDATIPEKCILNGSYIYCYDDDVKERKGSEYLLVNFELSFDDKPELNFATGYIELK